MSLNLSWVPPPQFLEQLDHVLHGFQVQSTIHIWKLVHMGLTMVHAHHKPVHSFDFNNNNYLAPTNHQYIRSLYPGRLVRRQSHQCRLTHGILMTHNSKLHNLLWPSKWLHIGILQTCQIALLIRIWRKSYLLPSQGMNPDVTPRIIFDKDAFVIGVGNNTLASR